MTTPPIVIAQAILTMTHKMITEAVTLAVGAADDNADIDVEVRLAQLADVHTVRAVRLHESLPWADLAEDLGVTLLGVPTIAEGDAARVIDVAVGHIRLARVRLDPAQRRPILLKAPGAINRVIADKARRHADEKFVEALEGLGVADRRPEAEVTREE